MTIPMTITKPVLIATAALVLSGCGGAPAAVDNPNMFSFESENGALVGSYNPAGWTTAEVREQVAASCPSGKLATYGEAKAANGLVSFTATCA